MTSSPRPRRRTGLGAPKYILETQIGFLLRQVSQRHSSIFVSVIGEDLTPTQWAALAKLHEVGAVSQNLLGRLTAMDGATIKGVVARLLRREFISTTLDPADGRRLIVMLTDAGQAMVAAVTRRALDVSIETLSPLDPSEQKQLICLLTRLR